MQRAFRAAFHRWGRPAAVRVDNGSPWGSWSDLPTPLALWLIGLGITVLWNPPRRPQDNGVVERSQGLARAWAEPERCRNVRQLQHRLDQEDQIQRECYPYATFGSRLEAFPSLAHSGRKYSRDWERRYWDWASVRDCLGGVLVRRRVDRSGKIGLYHTKPYVGMANRGREVVVGFDAAGTCWSICDPSGIELCRRDLTQFTPAGLLALPTK